MKRLQRSASMLLLSLSLSVMFLNLSSVKAYAVDFFYNQESFGSPVILYVDGSSVGEYVNVNSTYNVYHFSNSAKNITSNVHFIFKSSWDLQFDFENFDYYIYSVVDGDNYTGFIPVSVDISDYDSSGTRIYTPLLNPTFTEYNGRFDGDNRYGFSVLAQIPSNYYRPISSIRFNGSGSLSKNIDLTLFCIQVTKAADTAALNSIIEAINQQTDDINNKIDEVLTPEGENNLGEAVDQITDQVQENLGALGFAHDTVENFIGLFNEEPPAPIINVPPLKMKIKGVEHQFFNGYQYDFRSMEYNGLSVLVGAVRTAGTLVLWWAFLQYCLKEFDGFFRR